MSDIILFAFMMIPLVWSPGPNNILCASAGSMYGILGSTPFLLGINIPIFIYAVSTGLGLGLLIEQYPLVIEILKYVGAIYIFYLGWKILKSSTKPESKKTKIGFKSGFIISSLNAKLVLVLILMYSQFINTNGSQIMHVLTLSLGFSAVCLAGHFVWLTIGKVSSKLLLSEKALKAQAYIFSSMLFLTGVWILLG